MKRLLLALALLFVPALAHAQCNGVFPANTICGKVTTPGPPGPVSTSVLTGIPGGSNGQVQYNNAGTFGGDLLTNLINIACTAAPGVCANIFQSVNPAWYGAKCDNSTNDTVAMQNAIAGAAGKLLLLPGGTCVIAGTLTPASNTRIAGGGRDVSIIKQTAQNVIFNIANVSNVTISDLWLLGTDNYTNWASSPIGAITIVPTTAQSNLTFRNLRLSAFNATYWINLSNAGASGSTSNVTFDDIIITSTTADIPTDVVHNNNQNFGLVLYSGSGGIRWENLILNRFQIEGTGLCYGNLLFGNSYKTRITNGYYLNMGGTNVATHCTNNIPATNAYAISIYDLNSDGNPASDWIIQGNYILNPIAAGIYIVGNGSSFVRSANSSHGLITGNMIIGETYSDHQLARGGIAIGNSTDIQVVDNYLYGNATGLDIESQNSGIITVTGNYCNSSAGSSQCLFMQSGNNGSSNTDERYIQGNFFEAFDTSVLMTSNTTNRFNMMNFIGNRFNSNNNNLDLTNQFFTGMATVQGNVFNGAATGTNFLAGAFTGALYTADNAIYRTGTGLSGIPFANLFTAVNGSTIYVIDATAGSSPCTGGGSGALAIRQNGAWKCF